MVATATLQAVVIFCWHYVCFSQGSRAWFGVGLLAPVMSSIMGVLVLRRLEAKANHRAFVMFSVSCSFLLWGVLFEPLSKAFHAASNGDDMLWALAMAWVLFAIPSIVLGAIGVILSLVWVRLENQRPVKNG